MVVTIKDLEEHLCTVSFLDSLPSILSSAAEISLRVRCHFMIMLSLFLYCQGHLPWANETPFFF